MSNFCLPIDQIPCRNLTSNMYAWRSDGFVWAVDAGDASALLDYVGLNDQLVGVFITHAHYDHIMGLNELAAAFPNCLFYASDYAIAGIRSAKMNLSFYHEMPYEYHGHQCFTMPAQGVVLPNGLGVVYGLPTPGHNQGALTFRFHQHFFTGDSFIPGIPVVTKLKSGNRQQNIETLLALRSSFQNDAQIHPGHGPEMMAHDLRDEHFPDLLKRPLL